MRRAHRPFASSPRDPMARVRLVIRLTRMLAIAAWPLAPLVAQQPARESAPMSAEIANVRYEVTFDRATAAERTVRIATVFDVVGSGSEPVLLSLPEWTPGAYELTPFARWVVEFRASNESAASAELKWDKLDFDTWRVQPAGARTIRVSLTYLADTLDNAMAW